MLMAEIEKIKHFLLTSSEIGYIIKKNKGAICLIHYCGGVGKCVFTRQVFCKYFFGSTKRKMNR